MGASSSLTVKRRNGEGIVPLAKGRVKDSSAINARGTTLWIIIFDGIRSLPKTEPIESAPTLLEMCLFENW
jgi:hypothetical protein